MNLAILGDLLKSFNYDLEILCNDNERVLMHRIVLGALSEFWADLFIQQDYKPGEVASIIVPANSKEIRNALRSVSENPDGLLDILAGQSDVEKCITSYGSTNNLCRKDFQFSSEDESEDCMNSENVQVGENLTAKDLLERKQLLVEHMKNKVEDEEDSGESCDLCKGQFKNMDTHKRACERKKAEEEARREYLRQKKNQKLEMRKIIQSRKKIRREQSEIRKKQRKEEKILKRQLKKEQSECIVCETCERTFKNKSMLEIHITRVHTDPMECQDCDFKTVYKNGFRNHQLKHEGKITPVTCHICGMKRLRLRQHMMLVHEKREKTICPEPSCGKSI